MTAYYNEIDPGACAWLEELIRRGLIADGVVDRRSILEVQPEDLRGFAQCHFFAGIGGWSYALRLAKWPDDRPVWTGSPPCQPFSSAGKQLGRDDARHLAPHFISLVGAARPPVLFGEQVASADVFGKAANGAGKLFAGAPPWAWLDDLSDRLEAARYAVGASDIPAAGVDAPHIRQRTFFGAVRLADAKRGECGSIGLLGLLGLRETDGAQSGGEAAEPPRDSGRCGMADASGTRVRDPGRGADAGTQGRAEGAGPQWERLRNDAGHVDGRDGGLADAECAGSALGISAPQGRHEGQSDVAGDGGDRQSGSGAGKPDACGLADAPHEQHDRSRFGGTGRRAEYPDGSAIGGMADSLGARLEGQPGHGDRGSEPGRVDQISSGPTASGGWVGGLDHSASPRHIGSVERSEGHPRDEARLCLFSEGCREIGLAGTSGWGIGDEREQCGGQHGFQQEDGGAIWPGCGGPQLRPSAGRGTNAPDSPWRDPDWLFCRDGKWRPTQSSVLGLADGIPSELVSSGAFVPASSPLGPAQKGIDRQAPGARRVMRLKGYGNAIVPQAAAAFIETFDASVRHLWLDLSEKTTDLEDIFG